MTLRNPRSCSRYIRGSARFGLWSTWVFSTGSAQQQHAPGARELPQSLEIELALSALPSHLREDATVYTLNPEHGFEVAKHGSNGFHALVSRHDPSAFRGSWPFVFRDDILLPIAFDKIGAREHMQVYLDLARHHAEGMTATELKRVVLQRYSSGQYGPPERPGIAYMLAPVVRGYRSPEQNDEVSTVNFPHYMFYAPDMRNADIGGSREHVFIFASGPHAYMIHLASEAERKAINDEYSDLMSALCGIRAAFCVATSKTPAGLR